MNCMHLCLWKTLYHDCSHGEIRHLCIYIKYSYGIHKFKPSCKKKFHIYLCFVIVFILNVKVFLATVFGLVYTVTALYFRDYLL